MSGSRATQLSGPSLRCGDMKEVTLTFKGLSHREAETLARWYSGSGEQMANVWFEIHLAETHQYAPSVSSIESDESGNVIVTCKRDDIN